MVTANLGMGGGSGCCFGALTLGLMGLGSGMGGGAINVAVMPGWLNTRASAPPRSVPVKVTSKVVSALPPHGKTLAKTGGMRQQVAKLRLPVHGTGEPECANACQRSEKHGRRPARCRRHGSVHGKSTFHKVTVVLLYCADHLNLVNVQFLTAASDEILQPPLKAAIIAHVSEPVITLSRLTKEECNHAKC